ncbi:MAG TPA: hypothetical protein VEL80_07975 [Burkholderiales bacterium]|nr:hypothetical protein [Burkholderiales bacterium]
MGLLDDLKKQADLLKTQQIHQKDVQSDKLRLVEAKMKQAFLYVNELLKQLTVLKPKSPLMFSIPYVVNLQGLALADSFIDYRRKRINDKEYFDTVNFYVKWTSPNTVVIDSDNPAAIQRARESLWASKMRFTEEERKNSRGILIGCKFTVPATVITDITIKADHDRGNLLVQAKNLFGIGVDQLVVPAPEVSEDMLEDFAKALIGQQSSFRRFSVKTDDPKGAAQGIGRK